MSLTKAATQFGGGRYVVRDTLGSGNLGTVHRVFDKSMGCEVALKTLHVSDADSLFQIKREFRTLRPLRHGNLVRLFDLSYAPGEDVFYTMELLQGESLDAYVCPEVGDRPGTLSDAASWRRLSSCVSQVALALKTIHDKGLVHQDIKPENIIVLRGGRTVLADFGFVTAQGQSDLSETAGTPAFMAPEQMDGKLLPACDWYALGICLRHITRATPREEWPKGLEALQRSLTHPSYEQRGGYEDVLRWITSIEMLHSPAGQQDSQEFVGRENELAVLHEAFRAMRNDRQFRLVQISGESGIGKTALVEKFLKDVAEAFEPQPLIFTQRCHLRESVHLRILDSLVDELSRYLLGLSADRIEQLKPRNLGALLQLFPVLGRIPGFRSEALSYGDDSSFVAMGTRALKELIAKLSDWQSIIIFIDDFQWADTESLQAISVLLSPPDNPSILCIVSLRDEALSTESFQSSEDARSTSEFLTRMALENDISLLKLRISALDSEGCKALLSTRGVSGESEYQDLNEFISNCEGNPLLLTRLVQRFLDRRIHGSIDDCLKEELLVLSENERDLVKLIAISGHPISVHTLSRIYPRVQDTIEYLEDRAWLKQRLVADREYVDVFHDRIRHAVTLDMSREESQSLHYRLATMLRGDHGYSASHLVGHYLSAGYPDEAARFALEAAEESVKSFALNQAAELFETAFQLRGGKREDRWILERQAESLGAANRYVDSGEVYARLIELLEEELHQPLLLSRVYSRAADAFLRGGDVGHARSLFVQAVKELGIDLDSKSTRYLAKYYRLWIRFFTPELKGRIPAVGEKKIRLEILDKLVRTAVAVDLRLVNRLSVVRLREAIKCGDPDFAAFAAMNEGGLQCFLGGPLLESGIKLIRAGQSWHDGSDPVLNAMNERSECVVNLFLGKWHEGAQAGARGEKLLLEHLPNDQYELGMMRQYLFINLANLGEVAELSSRLRPLIVDARERRDIGRLIFYMNSQCALAHLSEDRSADVMAAAEEFSSLLPQDQFTTQHYFIFQAEILARLYERQYEAALERMSYRWDAIVRSNMLKTNYWGIELRSYRGIVYLSLAAMGIKVDDFRSEVREQIRALNRLPGGLGAARMLEGHLLLLEGKKNKAASRFWEAEEAWEGARMRLHQTSIRRRLVEIDAQTRVGGIDSGTESPKVSDFSKMMNCYLPAVRP